MAKETRQDRIVRTMIDQVTEHIIELKTMDSNTTTKESDVEKWCSSFLKNCLGYMASSGYSVRSQETKGRVRPDLIILKNEKPIFIVEVKKINFNFEKSDFRSGKVQLSEYLNSVGNVKWGMLTNGIEWKLYDFSNPQFGAIEISSFDLKAGDGDAFSVDKKSVEDLCYELFDFHEASFNMNNWSELGKEATAFSPESLTRAILSSDVIKYIGRSIRGEHEFKVSLEILSDKVYNLLELGLNEAISGWNEAKAVELQKYLKAQKRASRRIRRKTNETNKDEMPVQVISNVSDSIIEQIDSIDTKKEIA